MPRGVGRRRRPAASTAASMGSRRVAGMPLTRVASVRRVPGVAGVVEITATVGLEWLRATARVPVVITFPGDYIPAERGQ